MSNLPESIWTQEEYNRCILQLKSMGLSQESIAFILKEVIVVNSKPNKDGKQD
jgi:hypothetical protein